MARPGRKKRTALFIVEIICLLLFIGGLYVYGQIDSRLNKIETPQLDESKIVTNVTAPQMSGYTTYALFGIDQRSKNAALDAQNSDTIIIASINNDTKEVKLASVYRDTLLDIGNDTYTKANAAYAYGGPEQAITMLNTNLDLNITDYATVKFDALATIIDDLGGLDMDMSYAEIVHMNSYCVETAEDTGLSYTPIELPEKPEDQETITDDSHTAATENSKPILLIVEDNEDIQKYIAESFSDSFEVITGSNGEEGKQQALNRIPDIIVSDIMMPVMDGITLCRQLKEDVRTSHIPVILLTAKDSLQDKEEGYEVGADSYLTKPFSASLLRSRINNLLDSRKKLIAQFQQAGTNHNPNSHLDEKRSIITEALSKLDNEFIEKITQLVEDNLSSEKIDITYLSDKMCMSGSTLYRKMKALTGLSTNEYIRKVKMQNAERLLLEGKYNISEIAYKIGMNSTGYFRQCFKDEFGVSPSDYLKQFTSPTPPPSS